MSAEELRIAHISDLHWTSRMAWPPGGQQDEAWAVRAERLKQDLATQRPHALMVTGDIADNPAWELTDGDLGKAWDNALAFLQSVATNLDDAHSARTEDRLFVVPGNHDVRILGNITQSQLQAIVGYRLFRWARGLLGYATKRVLTKHGGRDVVPQVDALFDKRLPEVLRTARSASDHFGRKFGTLATSRRAPGIGFVYCIDSNADDALISFAQGQISGAEATQLLRHSEAWQREYADYSSVPKFALLHHHPMPMPLSQVSSDPRDSDAFLLLRNAGTFMRLCVHLGVDFVLHGHKHSDGTAAVSFPGGEGRLSRGLTVLGAGSVQQPHRDRLSYNLLRRLGDGSWEMEVRELAGADGQILPYTAQPSVTLVGADTAYRGMSRAAFENRKRKTPAWEVDRVDVFLDVDDVGDMEFWAYRSSLRPVEGEEASYPVRFSNESKRASFAPINFKDLAPGPSDVQGEIPLDPPATPERPKELVEFGLLGDGVFTLSQEYCRAYKGDAREKYDYAARANERVEAVRIEITLPAELFAIPGYRLAAELQVLRRQTPGDSAGDPPRVLVLDSAETTLRRRSLRVWPREHRIEAEIPHPVPGRSYRILWTLPEDEYAVLGEADRQETRAAITALNKRLLNLDHGKQEKEAVLAFLGSLGERITALAGVGEELRVDLAVYADTQIQVVQGVLCSPQGGRVSSPLRPRCALGETLRGKAFLQREIMGFRPGASQNEKDPARDPVEQTTTHQLAIPLVWPPHLPGFPRVGVLTFSSESTSSSLFSKFLSKNADPACMASLVRDAHAALARLSQDLGGPALPAVGPAPSRATGSDRQ